MSDVNNEETVDEGINVTPAMYRRRVQELTEMYDRISQASGSKTAGKRAIANRLVEANQDKVSTVVEQISNYLSGLDDASLAGVFTGLTKQLETSFSERVSTFLEAEVSANKTEAPPVSPEEVIQLTEEYKAGVKELGLLKSVLVMFGRAKEVEDIPEPKRMTGARGPRGKRALSQFIYSIGKDELPASDQSITKIAKAHGFDDSVGDDGKKITAASQLKSLILSRTGVEEPSELPDTWSIKLPDNKILNAVRSVEEDDEEEDEEVEDVA